LPTQRAAQQPAFWSPFDATQCPAQLVSQHTTLGYALQPTKCTTQRATISCTFHTADMPAQRITVGATILRTQYATNLLTQYSTLERSLGSAIGLSFIAAELNTQLPAQRAAQ
jgi:hypothetical protein